MKAIGGDGDLEREDRLSFYLTTRDRWLLSQNNLGISSDDFLFLQMIDHNEAQCVIRKYSKSI